MEQKPVLPILLSKQNWVVSISILFGRRSFWGVYIPRNWNEHEFIGNDPHVWHL